MKAASTLWVSLVLFLGVVTLRGQDALPTQSSTVAASTDARDPASAPNSRFQTRYPRYQIGPGDVLELEFSPASEFSQTVKVQPDGFITVREVGDLHVAGKTVPEVTQMLTSAYEALLRAPVIDVVLKEFDEPHFFVNGQVEHAGRYELRGDMTVSAAIAVAGGINEKAKHSQVLLFRKFSDSQVEVKNINLKDIYRGKSDEDIYLRPDDILFVPQNRISKIKPYLSVLSVGTYVGFPH